MEKREIKSLTIEELTEEMKAQGYPAFRAKQIYQWLHERLADSFEEMTVLSKDMRKELAERYRIARLRPVQVLVSKVDGTRKYLFALEDGNIIESVWMRYKHGNSVCISSQVGCRMGCKFCASTLDGLERDLLPAEMLEQVYQIQKDTGERVSHVVVMGSGEPLDNVDNLLTFIKIISGPGGLNISQRNITVSTCGIVPQILRLSEEGLQITLALSLHAPDDEVRKKLMPIAGRYPLQEVLEACRTYFQKTGRRITFEYSLIRGENDRPAHAHALARLIKDQHGHVNLIPVNPVRERGLSQPDKRQVDGFKNILEKNGINATIRREMGRDINGACGQLRRSFIQKMG